ncbi:MAG: phage tail tape measure protein [Clostridia bacterium]|nr:phage tail tape measure protein [Clostridia bacterium]
MADQVKVKITGDDKEFNESLKRAGETAKKSFAAVGVAVAAAAASVVKFGSEFEQSAAKASTLFGDVAVDTENLNKKMLSLSASVGVAATELNEGLYSALSAGVPVTEDMAGALDMLEQSAKLAMAGFTDTDTAIAATAKTLNAYGLDVSETERIQGILIQTQNKGITTVGELGASLAQVTPTAAAFKVSFENVGAALATMTAQGTPTAQATTQLNSLIAELGKSGTIASDNLKAAAEGTEYAGKSFLEMMESGAELNDVLALLQKAADESGVSMVDMFSSIEAGKAALSIMNQEGKTFTSNLEAMNNTAGLVEKGFETMANTAAGQSAIMKEGLKNLAITAYNSLDGAFTDLLKDVNTAIAGISASLSDGALGGALSFVISNFTALATAVIGSVAAVKAYNAIGAITTTVTTAWTAATTALTAMESAHALTLVASNGGLTLFQTLVGLCTGQITLKTAAVGLATKAQMLWNGAMSANPLGLLLAAVVAVTAAIAVFTLCMEDEKSEADLLAEEIDELTARVEENRKAYEQAREARKKAVSEIESEYGHYESLVEELDSLVDANGNVKEGYEDRANAITGILSDALGTEITLDSMVAQGKQAIIDNIYSLIEAKKQEALLSGYQEDYNKAIKEEAEAQQNLTEATINRKKAQDAVNKVLDDAREKIPDVVKEYENGSLSFEKFSALLTNTGIATKATTGTFEELYSNLKKADGEVVKASNALQENQNIQENFEFLLGAVASGEADKIEEAFLRINNSFKTAEVSTKSSLQSQVLSFEKSLTAVEEAFANGMPGVTQEMVDNYRQLYELAVYELTRWEVLNKDKGMNAAESLAQNFGDNVFRLRGIPVGASDAIADGVGESLESVDSAGAADKVVAEYADSISDGKGEVDKASNDVKQTVEDDLNSVDGADAGSKAVNEFAGSISAGAGEAQSASVAVAENAGAGFGSVSMAPYGMAATWSYANGISSNVGNIVGAWVSVQNATKNGLTIDISGEGEGAIQTFASGIQAKGPLAVSASGTIANNSKTKLNMNTYSSGTNFAQGFINGMRAMMSTVNATAYNMGRGAKNSLSSAIGEQSPAKETIKSGKYFGEGFVIGLNKSADGVNGASATLARGSLIAFNNELAKGVQDSVASVFAKGFKNGLPENDEENTKRFNSFKESLDKQLQYGVITQQEYYEGIAKYRDEYLTAGTKEWFDATDSIYEYTENALEEQIQSEREILDRSHRFGIISDAEYYASLEAIRDKYFKVGSDEWFDYTEEIFDYHEQLKEDAIEKAEEAREKAQEVLSDVLDEAKDFSEKLSDVGGLYDSDAIIGVEYQWSEDGRTLTEKAVKGIAPADLNAQTADIQRYADNLIKLKGKVPADLFGMLRDMSVKDGLAFTDALLAYDDEALNAYVKAFEEKERAIRSVTAELYGAEVVEASQDLIDAVQEEAGVKLPEKFFAIGEDSGEQFAEGFAGKLTEIVKNVSDVLDDVYGFSGMRHEYMHQSTLAGGTTYAPTYVLQSAEGESTARQMQTIQNAETQKRLRNWR